MKNRFAILSLVAALCFVLAPADAEATVLGPSHGDIGKSHPFGLGGHLGTTTGVSLKWFLGGGLGLNVHAGINYWWWDRGPGLRAEVDLVWHFTVAHHEKWEMLVGPGVGGGIGWWRHRGRFGDFCDYRDGRNRDECFGPFVRGLGHWSMLFHQWQFDVFAEPGMVIAFIPGFFVDFDILVGIRYYF